MGATRAQSPGRCKAKAPGGNPLSAVLIARGLDENLRDGLPVVDASTERVHTSPAPPPPAPPPRRPPPEAPEFEAAGDVRSRHCYICGRFEDRGPAAYRACGPLGPHLRPFSGSARATWLDRRLFAREPRRSLARRLRRPSPCPRSTDVSTRLLRQGLAKQERGQVTPVP